MRKPTNTCILSKNNSRTLTISLWGAARVLIFDIQKKKITDTILVGDHPNDLCLSGDGHILFVANANDNSVSVVDLKTRRVLETLDAALYPGSAVGSTSNAVALSQNEKTLYIANADNNCLAVLTSANRVIPGLSDTYRLDGIQPVSK